MRIHIIFNILHVIERILNRAAVLPRQDQGEQCIDLGQEAMVPLLHKFSKKNVERIIQF